MAAAPAIAYGPVPVDPPAGAVMLSPGADIQAAVNANLPGTTFFLQPGIYRLQGIRPRNRDVFIGALGARLNGARLLTSFNKSGGHWVAHHQPIDPEAIVHGECLPGYPRCDHPQDLYFDGKPLRAVAKRDDVAAGTFFYDYDQNDVYFADDPSGHTVELSYRAYAFGGAANNVTVRNLIIENYAAADQRGAINNSEGRGWTIADNEIRWNHGYGVVDGSGDQVSGNSIHHNGEIGIGGGGTTDVNIENNEIAYNVWNGTDCQWECGGAKWGNVSRLRVAGNFVHHNQGDGLWTDIDCLLITYDHNRIEHNLYAGISHEISGTATISNNFLRANGARTFNWGWQGQIQIQNSSDTEVFGNTLVLGADRGGNGIIVIQQNRGAGHMPRHNRIHDNDVTMAAGEGAVAGWFADYKPDRFADADNLFDHNHYHCAPDRAGNAVWAPNDWVGFAAWQATGQDVHSTRDGHVNR